MNRIQMSERGELGTHKNVLTLGPDPQGQAVRQGYIYYIYDKIINIIACISVICTTGTMGWLGDALK